MQAVVLAGGLGTRLRPLTYTRPKALLPLVNKPMILHVLERLPSAVDEVLLAASHLTDRLEAFFQSTDVGRPVSVVRERTALGTGGALKNLADRLSETFLAFNVDVVASLAVADLVAAHRRFGGIGTLALWEVEDPSAFGVVVREGDRITKFVEKPARGAAPSRLANAGMYVFEPDLLEAMSAGEVVSLERDVFPKVVRKGLYGLPFAGYWADAGTLDGFLRATAVLLNAQGTEVNRRATVRPEASLRKPVAVAADADVAGRIGPDTAVGVGCRIGRARVHASVLFEGVTVADGAEVSGSLVGTGGRIGADAVVRDAILGDGVAVPSGTTVDGERVR